MARLEEQLFVAMERIGTLEKENARLGEENRRLHEENARLRAEVERLGKENTQLQQQLAAARKDSSTSSKPPSSDMVKPKKPPAKGGKRRKRGGQPGHEQHVRKPPPPEAVQHFQQYTLDCCPVCKGKLVPLENEEEVIQQVEILPLPIEVTEHRGLAYRCVKCGAVHPVPIPEVVRKAGLFGPRLTALVAFMKGVCHAWFSTIGKFLRNVLGVNVSRGYLAKLLGKGSEALEAAREQVLKAATTRLPEANYAQNLAKAVPRERRSVLPLPHHRRGSSRRTIRRHPEGTRRFALW